MLSLESGLSPRRGFDDIRPYDDWDFEGDCYVQGRISPLQGGEQGAYLVVDLVGLPHRCRDFFT